MSEEQQIGELSFKLPINVRKMIHALNILETITPKNEDESEFFSDMKERLKKRIDDHEQEYISNYHPNDMRENP